MDTGSHVKELVVAPIIVHPDDDGVLLATVMVIDRVMILVRIVGVCMTVVTLCWLVE